MKEPEDNEERLKSLQAQNERLNADLRRLHIWASIAATYVERYTRLALDDRNARNDLERLRQVLSEIVKPIGHV